MKHWGKDDIVEEVRRNRELIARQEEADPEKFHKASKQLAKKLGIKRSPLRPIKIDLARLHGKTRKVA